MRPSTANVQPPGPAPREAPAVGSAEGGPQPRLTLFFDGLCPVCAREMAFLRRRDRAGRLAFVDIAEPAFDPRKWGLSLPDLVGRMHAVDVDGRVIDGPEVFRRAYAAVGLGWLMSWTAWPGLRTLADVGYRLFARIRPRLSRFECGDRCSLAERPRKLHSSP